MFTVVDMVIVLFIAVGARLRLLTGLGHKVSVGIQTLQESQAI